MLSKYRYSYININIDEIKSNVHFDLRLIQLENNKVQIDFKLRADNS